MKKLCILFYALCSIPFFVYPQYFYEDTEQIIDDNGELSEEAVRKFKSTPFHLAMEYAIYECFSQKLKIRPYRYEVVEGLYPFLRESEKDVELIILDENDHQINWNYAEYIKNQTVSVDWSSSCLELMNIDCELRESFIAGVILKNGKKILVTLYGKNIGAVWECDFKEGQVKLIKEKVIPPLVISRIDIDNTLSQKDGLEKLYSLIMDKESVISINATPIEETDLKKTEQYYSHLYINSNYTLSSTTFLKEGKINYSIDNAKNRNGLPFVPESEHTFSTIITINSDVIKNRGLLIQNGYLSKERPDLFKKNCRVKTIKILYPNMDSSFIQIATLKDDDSLQFIPFIWVLINDCKEVQIMIDSIYSGSKYNDVCINYLGIVSQTETVFDER